MTPPSAVPDDVDLTIVGGAGHVGLPLALVFANEGLRTLIYDVNEAALDAIASGCMPHMERDAGPLLERALRDRRLFMTSDIARMAGTGAVIITIGTPVDEFRNPVHTAIQAVADAIHSRLSDGQLVILRSTVYPGTTEWLDRYFKSKGRHVKVAFCPERVVQGHAIRELREIPQIVSGTTDDALDGAKALFGMVARHVVCMQPMEAELAKLFCNAVRYIHFATSNEFHMIAGSAGLDYNRIYEGMVEDFPRAEQHARAGFAAGPCLFKDTAQLVAYAANNFTLGSAAMQVNEGLVLYVVEGMRARFDLRDMTVGLLGMAFKADIDDTRSSLSYKMKKMLSFHARTVLATDPFVTGDPDLRPIDAVIEESDILVLCTPHSAYRGLNVKGKPVVDVWGFLGR